MTQFLRQRRSIRLKGYDYSQQGLYFITICTQERACLFGDVLNGQNQLNDAGKMVEMWFYELAQKFPSIQCDAFVCMPNHVHFVVDTTGDHAPPVGADLRVCPSPVVYPFPGICPYVRPSPSSGEHAGSPLHHVTPPSTNLSKIIQWFKTMTTNAYIRGIKDQGWPAFNRRLWQRNYYEHIVRNDDDLTNIREYIQANPLKWELDQLHPDNAGGKYG